MSLKVFISSTYSDLIEYRQKAFEAIERSGQYGIRMEMFGSRSKDSTTVCQEEIDEADLLLGIYAHRYGFIPSGSDISITEMEYNYAVSKKKAIFCFIIDDDYPWKPSFIEGNPAKDKLYHFKEIIKNLLVSDTFTTPEDLAIKVASSLGRFIYKLNVKEKLDLASNSLHVGPLESRDQVAKRASLLSGVIKGSNILLVNDIPTNMQQVINIYRTLGFNVTVTTTSDEALTFLSNNQFDLIVSDMSRGSVMDEGLRFLKEMKLKGLFRPIIFTVGRYQPERGTPPFAFGITNQVDELIHLTFDIVERLRL